MENRLIERLLALIKGELVKLKTAFSGNLKSFDIQSKQASIWPKVSFKYQGNNIAYPEIQQVNVLFPANKKAGVIYPISKNDEGILVISDRQSVGDKRVDGRFNLHNSDFLAFSSLKTLAEKEEATAQGANEESDLQEYLKNEGFYSYYKNNYLKINDDNLQLKHKHSVQIEAGEQIISINEEIKITTAEGEITVTKEGSVLINAKGNLLKITEDGSFELKCRGLSIEVDNAEIKADKIRLGDGLGNILNENAVILDSNQLPCRIQSTGQTKVKA